MNKSKLISRILIFAGIAMLLAAGGLFVYNQIFDYQAGVSAQELLDEMMSEFDWDLPPMSEMTMSNFNSQGLSAYNSNSSAAEAINGTGDPSFSLEPESYVGQRPAVDRGNDDAQDSSGGTWSAPTYYTIGIISIPKLGVRLPVLSECSSALLNKSCCRISGLVTDRPIRLVIAGHNINSHFKGLDTFQNGDEIAFTTREGVTYFYRAIENSSLHKSEGAEVLAVDGWDITLLTCKKDNTYRTMVRFVEIKPDIIEEETDASAESDSVAEIEAGTEAQPNLSEETGTNPEAGANVETDANVEVNAGVGTESGVGAENDANTESSTNMDTGAVSPSDNDVAEMPPS
ncbi:MAG: sortase [Oscillospiraceae bacterium]|nr:sortase [Oscillospiraceae bacterium]